MDVLIFTGAFAAFVYSVSGWLMHGNGHLMHEYLFFETGTTIITLVLLGNLIEKRSVKQTAADMMALQELRPSKARKVTTHNGHEHIEEVQYDAIKKGDVLMVSEGDRVPMDGEIISGECLADESIITGESIPVNKSISELVIGGTLNLKGSVRIKATNDSKSSVLTSIIETVKKAQSDKAPAQRLADKVSAVFVPVVIGFALLTFVINNLVIHLDFKESMMRAIAVLVISCPCAMGLATPTAVMVGIGKAARRGILITKASAMEVFAKVNQIVFDKTGTLTDGRFLFDVEISQGYNKDEILNLIWNLESHSTHPLAKSIVNQTGWSKGTLQFESVTEIKGFGLKAVLNNDEIIIGRSTETESDLMLKINGIIAAGIKVKDELKAGSKDVIGYFNEHDVKTILISGDKKKKCELTGTETGIKTIHAEQMPEQKLNLLSEYSKTGITAMTGDGVNDAPALSKADVAVSFGNATAIARQSSQIILLRNDIKILKDAHIISSQTFRVIKQNLFWAFAYNVIAIPLAAAGYMHPMLAAASMAFSDVVVIGNAIRLRFTKVS